MANKTVTTSEEVAKLRETAAQAAENAARAAEEAARAAEEAEHAAEEHAVAEHEHHAEHGEHHAAAADGEHHAVEYKHGELRFTTADFEEDLEALDTVQDKLAASTGDLSLTTAERFRLNGTGVRRLGFIEKVTDTATEKPQFSPPFFDLDELQDMARQIEVLRAIRITAQAIDRMAGDAMLVTGNASYQLALAYYAAVRDAARRGIVGAQEIFTMLERFFKATRRTSGKPSEMEVIRDVKALLHGKKDGEITVTGHAKHETAAEHAVIDDTHRPSEEGKFKETVSGTVCHNCNTHNPPNARYCNNCAAELIK